MTIRTILSLCFPLRRLTQDRSGVAAVEAALTLPVLIALLMGMIEMWLYIAATERVATATQLTADLIGRQTSINSSTGTVSPTNISAIFTATNLMLDPMTTSSTNPTIDVASILFATPSGANNLLNGNSAVNAQTCTGATKLNNNIPAGDCVGIDWEQTQPSSGVTKTASSTTVFTNYDVGCTQANLTACYCVLSSSSIVSGSSTVPTCAAPQSMIYAQVNYTYNDPVAFFLPIILGTRTIVITETAFAIPRAITATGTSPVQYVPICTSADTTTSACT